MRGLLDVFEDLGFSCTWVTKEEDIDVSADLVFSTDVFGYTAEKGQCDCSFDIFVAVDTWRDGIDDLWLVLVN